MVSEDKVITTTSKCVCGKNDEEHGKEVYFENVCPVCGKEGNLQTETLFNIEVDDEYKSEHRIEHDNPEGITDSTINDDGSNAPSNKVICKNCGAEFCGQDGYDLSGGTRAGLNVVNPNEITGAEDELSSTEDEETTYMSGWEGLCDLLRPLDAEAMIIQRGDYVIVKKIDMPQSASLWAYEGINVVDDSVTVTDYTPEIYNTFVIRWGESFDNELEFTFKKHKQLFGERKQILEAKKYAVVSDEESEDSEKKEKDNKKSEGGGLFSGITDMIFGTGGEKEKNKDKKNSSDSKNTEEEDEDKPESEEVPITTKEEAMQFGLKQIGKAKRDDGHTIELKVIGNQNWVMGEWCHVRLPSFNEDSYMFISKCGFESSPDNEYINSLTLVDYPPSLGKPLNNSGSEEESNDESENDENANADAQNSENGGNSSEGSNNSNNNNSSSNN